MTLEEGVTEILANGRGFRVVVTMDDGETSVLRRAREGMQISFPNRPKSEPLLLASGSQQDEPGSIQT